MILFIGNDASRSGAPLVLLDIVRYIHGKEDIIILLSNGGDLCDEYRKYGKTFVWAYDTSVINNPFTKLYYKFAKTKEKYQKKALKEIANCSPQIIFNNTIGNREILEALKFLNAPVLSYVHEMEYVINVFDALYNNTARYTFQNSDFFITVSNASKRNLIGNHDIPEEKILIVRGTIPNYKVDEEKKFPESFIEKAKNKNKFIVGYCGNPEWRKGADIFIQVADKLINQLNSEDIVFVWLGGNEFENNSIQFNFEIRKRKLNNSVKLYSRVSNTSQFYKSFDVFICTSREDPFPLVVLEAALHGLPVICFKDAGGAEEFIGEDCGFSVPYLNIDEMAEKILLLKNDKLLYDNCSENIKKKVKSFTNTGNIDAIYNHIKQVESTFGRSI